MHISIKWKCSLIYWLTNGQSVAGNNHYNGQCSFEMLLSGVKLIQKKKYMKMNHFNGSIGTMAE